MHHGTFPARLRKGRSLLQEIIERKEGSDEHSAVGGAESLDGSTEEFIELMGRDVGDESEVPVNGPVTTAASPKDLPRFGSQEIAEDQESFSSGAKVGRQADHHPPIKTRAVNELQDLQQSKKEVDIQLDLATKARLNKEERTWMKGLLRLAHERMAQDQDEKKLANQPQDSQRSMQKSGDQFNLATDVRLNEDERTITRSVRNLDIPVGKPVPMPTWPFVAPKRAEGEEDEDRRNDPEDPSNEVKVDKNDDPRQRTREELRTLLESIKSLNSKYTGKEDMANNQTWDLWRSRAAIIYSGRDSWEDLIRDAEKSGIPKPWARRELRGIADAFERSSSASFPEEISEKANDAAHVNGSTRKEESQPHERVRVTSSEKLTGDHRLWLARARIVVYQLQNLHDHAVTTGQPSAWVWEQLARIAATKDRPEETPSTTSSFSYFSTPSSPLGIRYPSTVAPSPKTPLK